MEDTNGTVARSPETSKPNVFISYSRDDLAFADHLDVALDLAGFDPILDRHGIHGAEDWEGKLGTLIRDADTVVFVLSPSSAVSEACAWEVKRARELGKKIVPVVARPLGETKAPPDLAKLNYIYFYPEPKKPGSGVKSGSEELIKALKLDLAWMQKHTRYLQRAIEWRDGERNPHRLLSGNEDIAAAKTWLATHPKDAPPPTELHVEFIRASEKEEAREQNEERQRLADMAAAQAAREAALAEREQALKREAGERAAREAAQLAATEAAKREAETAKRVVRRTYAGMAAALVLAGIAGAFGYVAWQQRLKAETQTVAATAAATRAKLAEEQARSDQERAQRAEFDAIINECAAGEALMTASPSNPQYFLEYLSCGIRLGYALVRDKQFDDAKAYLKRLKQVATERTVGADEAIARFYILLIDQAQAVADCAAAKREPQARADTMTRLVAAADQVLAYQAPDAIAEKWQKDLEGRWREELFRGLLYISRFSSESGNYEVAHMYASRLVDRFTSMPSDDVEAARVLARALGQHAWTAILSKRFDEALRSSIRATQLVEMHSISDLDLVRINRAHALYFNGRIDEAREAYQTLEPTGLERDADDLKAAGLCNQSLNDMFEGAAKCAVPQK